MNFDDTPEEARFRAEARAWLEAHARRRDADPAQASFYDFSDEFVAAGKRWQATLYEGGWAGIAWPPEFGGRGATPMEQVIFAQEQSQFDVPQGLFYVAIGMAGPTLIAWGTAEQRDRYLAPMLRGDEVWCQLFSEPGAGSDLANVRTRAERDGDEWVVNGQKVWSSGAHQADLGILLARTDPDAPKHRGLSYFVVDMRTPGIDVRPLRQMTGGASFNEVFLTDVRLPAANLVGELHGGWGVAMTTLAHERNFGSAGGVGFNELVDIARKRGTTGDPVVRRDLVDVFIRAEILRFLGYRMQTVLSRGGVPGADTSIAKLFYSEHARKTADVAVALQGPNGMLEHDDAMADGVWQHYLLSGPSLRIAAGTDEVQRNILGERMLGLPAEPRTDKTVPFRELTQS